MKIAFISYYSGYVHRGMETVVHELATRFSINHDVTVIQAGPKAEESLPYAVKKIPMDLKWPTIDSRGLFRKLFIDYYSKKIAQFTIKSKPYLKDINPDIIFPTNGGWSSLICKQLAKQLSSKLVISGQAGLGWDDRWNLKINPDLFVALSKRNLNWADQYQPKVNKTIINNGVDLHKFRPNNKSNLPKELTKKIAKLPKPVILCVAGSQPYKRVADTIHAVDQLTTGSLLLVRGGGIQDNDPDKILGEKILKDRFLSIDVTHSQIPAIYTKADLFTLVSESTEAFGVAYIEALASGLPVVATDDLLRREIINDAGLYLKDPSDHLKYSQTIKKALSTQWGNKPRTQAKKFDWDKIAKAYEEAFIKLMDS